MNPHPPLPPKWIERFFRWYCDDILWEYLEGDLYELYFRRIENEGLSVARRKFLCDVLSLIRPFTLRRKLKNSSHSIIYTAMLFHNLKFILRNLKRNYGHTLINVLGLSLGLVTALVIFLKVKHDMSFDGHIPESDRIFRLVTHTTNEEGTDYNAGMPGAIPMKLQSEFPEIAAMAIVDRNMGEPIISFTDKRGNPQKFKEEWAAWVWPDFFQVIPYDWIQGDPQLALKEPNTCVLTESLALKYFGELEVVGKVLRVDDDADMKVMGLVKDPPPATSFPFQIYMSKADELIPGWLEGQWWAFAQYFQCFVKLAPNTTSEMLESRFPEFLHRHGKSEEIDTAMYQLYLQPIHEMHLDGRYDSFAKSTQETQTLWALGLIGFFLLITACINFVNLNIALIVKRAREVGLRKVLGSRNKQIFRFFLFETGIVVLGAMILAVLLLPLVLQKAQFLLEEPLAFSPMGDPLLWIYLGLFFVVTLIFAGYYPSWLLSRTQPVSALKNTVEKRYGKGFSLRKGLIIVQFAISQLLIICTLVTMRQMDYFHSAPLGFDKEAVVEMFLPTVESKEELVTLKSLISQHASIESVSFSNNGTATNGWWRYNVNYFPNSDTSQEVSGHAQIKMVDPEYVETYGIELIIGKNFREWDTLPYILVNETFLEEFILLSPEEAIGKQVRVGGRTYSIQGITEDYTTESLRKKIEPVVIVPNVDNVGMCGVKLVGGSIQKSMAHIEQVWATNYPEELFEYEFLDDKITQMYETELRATRLFQTTAALSIFIGMLGLLGLISLAANSRVQEIGIRKVLGATVTEIVSLFTKEFFWLVLMGFVVAAPLGWFLMKRWLEEFAYKISLGGGIFVTAFGLSLLLMLLIVGMRSYKSATMNPVDAIRSE
ncbi:MAG: FtsX-like permease family protein [Bacteroidota bacterium]